MSTTTHIIIAIDGPAGSGKSTTAKLVAKKLGFVYVDTGAMYRAVTLSWIRQGKPDIDIFLKQLPKIELRLHPETREQCTILDGIDVSQEIRSSEVTQQVSYISSLKEVRETMVSLQRNIGSNHDVVMDGRDIGTAVFPNANLKIFMIADIQERAKRRLMELTSSLNEDKPSLEDIIDSMKQRDAYDSGREIDPLKMAEDAILLDTSQMSIEEQADFIIKKAEFLRNTFQE